MAILLSKHQKKVFYWQKQVQHPGFFLKMRLGKTRLTIFCLKYDSLCFPALIVCPYSAISGWVEELHICGYDESDYILLTDPETNRKNVFNIRKFSITYKESHRTISKQLASIQWGSVVLDESTFVKNYKTNISKFYTKNFRDVHRRFILTGTPTPEGEQDIFQQALFLNPDIFYETKSHYQFMSRYFTKDIYGWSCNKKNRNLIANRLSKHCYVMSQKDAGLYIDKVYQRRKFRLTSETFNIYNNFVKNFILEIGDEIYKVTEYVIAQFIILRQLCSGFVKNPETEKHELIDKTKLNLLLDLVKNELLDNQIIIWCDFIHELKSVQRLLNKNVISSLIIYGETKRKERDNRIKDFQKSKVRILVAHPACFEEGTKLNNADTTIYFSSPLGGKRRSQTEARMNNPFKKETDLIIDLIAEGTIEERIIQKHLQKENRQKFILDTIKFLQRQIKCN